MADKKKIAPEAATSETKAKGKLSVNSILKNGGKVKVLIKRPGDVPQIVRASGIPPEFLSRKLRCESLGGKMKLVYDAKSGERVNISVGGKVFRGMIVVAGVGFNRIFELSGHDADDAFVWLMRRSV